MPDGAAAAAAAPAELPAEGDPVELRAIIEVRKRGQDIATSPNYPAPFACQLGNECADAVSPNGDPNYAVTPRNSLWLANALRQFSWAPNKVKQKCAQNLWVSISGKIKRSKSNSDIAQLATAVKNIGRAMGSRARARVEGARRLVVAASARAWETASL